MKSSMTQVEFTAKKPKLRPKTQDFLGITFKFFKVLDNTLFAIISTFSLFSRLHSKEVSFASQIDPLCFLALPKGFLGRRIRQDKAKSRVSQTAFIY